MLTGRPVLATCPTMPQPHGTCHSSALHSLTVELALTSNSLLTRRGSSASARRSTRNSEQRSAASRRQTFWRILCESRVTSRSLQMSMTSSFISEQASSARSSLLRRRAVAAPGPPSAEAPPPAARKDGTPSTVATIRLSVFPRRSNSCAETFRAGVLAPEPGRVSGDAALDCAGVVIASDVVQDCAGVVVEAGKLLLALAFLSR